MGNRPHDESKTPAATTHHQGAGAEQGAITRQHCAQRGRPNASMKSIGLVAPTLLRLLLLLLVPASPASSSSFAFAFAFFLPPIQRPNLKLLTFQPGQQRSSSCGSRAGSFLHHSHRWGLPVRSASVASDRSAVGSTHTLSAEVRRVQWALICCGSRTGLFYLSTTLLYRQYFCTVTCCGT